MPYGISKTQGGDSPENDARMEAQVAAIQRSGQDKVSAIKIAKAQWARRRSPRADAMRRHREVQP